MIERGERPAVFLKGVLKEDREKAKGRMIREKCPKTKGTCFQKEWAQAQ